MILQVFERVNHSYRQKLRAVFNEGLEKLKDSEPEGRMFIESFDKVEERFKRKLKREYRFIVNPLREKLSVLMNARLLFA